MSSGAFGLRAARLLDGWLRRTRQQCRHPGCYRTATWWSENGGGVGECCDAHRSLGMREYEYAPLIRETEHLIAEANERPSVRALPTGGR